jgi:hypothetical protein
VFAGMTAAVVGTGAAGWRLAAVEPGASRG